MKRELAKLEVTIMRIEVIGIARIAPGMPQSAP